MSSRRRCSPGRTGCRSAIGVLPVPLRNVALTAMETAALHRLFPGRVTVGVGHGVQGWMGQVGARAESPVTLLGEYLQALRGLLRGERLTVDGRYVQLDDVALDWPPPTPPPVLAAAAGPRTLRLSGQFADGTIIDSRPGTGTGCGRPAGRSTRAAPRPAAPARTRSSSTCYGDRPGRGAAARGDGAAGDRRRRGRRRRGRGGRPRLGGGRSGQGRAPPRPRRPGPGGLRQVRRRAGAAAARVTRGTRPLRTGRSPRRAGRARPARRAPR